MVPEGVGMSESTLRQVEAVETPGVKKPIEARVSDRRWLALLVLCLGDLMIAST
jgi:hypothetical protein